MGMSEPLKIQNFGMAGRTRRCEAFGAGRPTASRSRTRGLHPTVSREHRKEPRSE